MGHRRSVRATVRPEYRLHPRKSLGQHFLQDQRITEKILAAFNPKAHQSVLEIGPGQGVLTRRLIGAVRSLVAVEIDSRLVAALRGEFGSRVQILQQDILGLDLRLTAQQVGATEGLRVLGNIPYNITTPILFKLLDERTAVKDALLMMQREVARRLVALPGSKEYGIPSVFCRIFTDVELLFDVSPTAFSPRPAVTSSVIRLEPLAGPRSPLDDETFFRKMVRFVFGQRRKMLRNTLAVLAGEYDTHLPQDLALRERPEELTPEELVALSNSLYRRLQPGSHP